MNITVRQQKPSDKNWIDEAGKSIPYDRTTPLERTSERKLASITKEAIGINKQLVAFKDRVRETAQELYAAFIIANGGKAPGKGKGGITLYNFNQSIKVEVSVNEQIKFDENLIGLAKAKLDELLTEGLNGAMDFIKPLVMDAFSTTRGGLDTKAVLGLKRYQSRVKHRLFDEAVAFIDKAIRRPDSKEYFRVWVKDDQGQYQDVQLNFSAI